MYEIKGYEVKILVPKSGDCCFGAQLFSMVVWMQEYIGRSNTAYKLPLDCLLWPRSIGEGIFSLPAAYHSVPQILEIKSGRTCYETNWPLGEADCKRIVLLNRDEQQILDNRTKMSGNLLFATNCTLVLHAQMECFCLAEFRAENWLRRQNIYSCRCVDNIDGRVYFYVGNEWTASILNKFIGTQSGVLDEIGKVRVPKMEFLWVGPDIWGIYYSVPNKRQKNIIRYTLSRELNEMRRPLNVFKKLHVSVKD